MIERVLNRLFEKKIIVNCERQPYLHRWYLLRTKRVSIFIHKFVRSDEDRALHDHPWNFVVVPVWRGYREHNDKSVRNVSPLLGTRFRSAEYRHRVELRTAKNGELKPAWSLFIRFAKRREWGFWEPQGFIQWNKWWQDKCE